MPARFMRTFRVMNARDERIRLRVLVRRGMTYGPDRGDLSAPNLRQSPPSSGVGILFLSFQHSLLDFITLIAKGQKQRDPMLTRSSQWSEEQKEHPQKWTVRGSEFEHAMADLTTTRGGEYFYIPSMLFIEDLA